MVKPPDKPPDWEQALAKDPSALHRLSHAGKVRALIAKAQSRYDHWDKFRSQPFPKGTDRILAWAYLKFLRSHQTQPLPITSVDGLPLSYSLTENLCESLYCIDEAARGYLGLKEEAASAKHYTKSLMEEAITSSQIEGAVGTIKEAKEMLLSQRKPLTTSERMIYNNFLTMQSLKELCKEKLSHKLLFEIHASITQNTLESEDEVGRYRKESECVRIETVTGEVLFVPPKAKEIKGRLDALFEFANDSEHPFIHPVIKGIILHFWLAYIHPFVDGNGRVARALFYWYLMKKGYWLFEYVSISRSIIRKSSQYARAYLYTQTDDGDLTYFISFNIQVILEAIQALEDYLRREEDQERKAASQVAAIPGLNSRQARFISHALSHPKQTYTIRRHQAAQGISYQTARADLLGLADKGLLNKIQRGKAFVFVPAPAAMKRLS